VVNGLSDHDAQMLELHIGNLKKNKHKHKPLVIRKINSNTIHKFKDKMSNELWQGVFEHDDDVSSIFNSFLNVYLQIFYSCFPKISVSRATSNNQWISKGIINSCKQKKDLFMLTRNNNNIQLKEYYKKYSKILSQVVRTAKILHHNRLIIKSNNTIKTTWIIIKSETGWNDDEYDDINALNSDTEQNKNNSVNAEIFNKLFLMVANNIACKIKGSNEQNFSDTKDPLSCLKHLIVHLLI